MNETPAKNQIQTIVVSGVGLVCPVGHDSVSATAAIRAGISRFREIPNFATPTGARAAGAIACGLTEDRSGTDRLLVMAIPALREALRSATASPELLKRSRMLLCLGPANRPRFENFEASDIEDLLRSTEAETMGTTEIVTGGHSIGAAAIAKAVALLQQPEIATCVVGGIDSLLEFPVLRWLDSTGRLKTDDRSDGLIPGEAAAFLILEREVDTRRRGAPVMARVLPPVQAREGAHFSSGLPLRGLGLAETLGQNLRQIAKPLDGIVCDLNGEYYRTKEWVLAMPRVFKPAEPVPELWHPAENIGDVGAASAAVFVAVACRSIQRHYFQGQRILIWTSSDDGERGSIIVDGTPELAESTANQVTIRNSIQPLPLGDVLQEYTEEAAFLYSARKNCLTQAELSWEDLASRERRLDMNLHGLILGGMRSARLLKSKLTLEADGDPGEAFTAGAVYPSLGFVEPMEWLTEALAAGGPHYRAILDGLLYNEDPRLDPWVGDYLQHPSPFVRAAGAEIVAKRQPAESGQRLAHLLEDADPKVLLAALGAVPDRAGTLANNVIRLLNHQEPEVVDFAVRLLLSAGNREVLHALRQRMKEAAAEVNQRLVLLLGTCGHADDRKLIVDLVTKQPQILPECILALGLLGAPQAIEYLISQLADPSQERAYLATIDALRMISGKDLLPAFDLEEAQPQEVARFQELWRQWHSQQGANLQPNTKYRAGLPVSTAALLADLRRRGNPKRDLSFLEMKFRYGCPVDFRHDGRYAIQVTQLNQIENWAGSSSARPLQSIGKG